jgi:Smg protein
LRHSHWLGKALRYIEAMFEVLVFVYENYWRGDACPEPAQLGRKLSAVGFDADEIEAALDWLGGLHHAAKGILPDDDAGDEATLSLDLTTTSDALRVYSVAEQEHLGAESLGFVHFLETAGVLPAPMREIVLDRAMAAQGGPVSLADLKIIVLMVYWSFGTEPDALLLDELCQDASARVAH